MPNNAPNTVSLSNVNSASAGLQVVADETGVEVLPMDIHELKDHLTAFLNNISPLSDLIINYYFDLSVIEPSINSFMRSLKVIPHQTAVTITPENVVSEEKAVVVRTGSINQSFRELKPTMQQRKNIAIKLLLHAIEAGDNEARRSGQYEALLVNCLNDFIQWEYETQSESEIYELIYQFHARNGFKTSNYLLEKVLLWFQDNTNDYLHGLIGVIAKSYKKFIADDMSQDAEEALFLMQIMLSLGYNENLDEKVQMVIMVDCAIASDVPELLEFIIPADSWFNYIHKDKTLAEHIILQTEQNLHGKILGKLVEVLQNNPQLKIDNIKSLMQVVQNLLQIPLEQYHLNATPIFMLGVSALLACMGEADSIPIFIVVMVIINLLKNILENVGQPLIIQKYMQMQQAAMERELALRQDLKIKRNEVLGILLQLLVPQEHAITVTAIRTPITDSKYSAAADAKEGLRFRAAAGSGSGSRAMTTSLAPQLSASAQVMVDVNVREGQLSHLVVVAASSGNQITNSQQLQSPKLG